MNKLLTVDSKLSSLNVSQQGVSARSNLIVAIQQILRNGGDGERRMIEEWLSSLNFWAKQNDYYERAAKGTGEWLLKDEKFEAWTNGACRVLWCPGDRIVPVLEMLTS
jgi:hypothetical protein